MLRQCAVSGLSARRVAVFAARYANVDSCTSLVRSQSLLSQAASLPKVAFWSWQESPHGSLPSGHAVVSYVVSHRVGEIGIRMALGARASQVARLVVRQAIGLTMVGVALGVVGALATTRALGSLLYDVAPTDPIVLGGVSILLLVIAVVASLAPTRRAVRVEPAAALRRQ